MTESRRVTIRLPPDLLEKIAYLVSSGEYKTISDVVRTALLRFLEEKESPPYVSKITVELPRGNVVKLEEIVTEGDAVSINDAIRDAVREYLRKRTKTE